MNRTALVKYFFLIFSLTGCVFQKQSPVKSTHWLRIALSDKVVPSDWTQCQNNSCLQYASLVMEGLFNWKQVENAVEVEPALCETWKFEDPQTLVLQIRKSVYWTNGEALTSQDFLDTWKRNLSSRNFLQANTLFPILNAKAFYNRELPFEKVGLSAPNPNTLIIKLHSKLNLPAQDFLLSLASPLLFPTFNGKPNFTISLGKFKSLPTSKSETSIFVKNERYYGASPKIDGIEIRSIANPQVRSQLFLDKEVDFVDELPMEFWESPHFNAQLSLAPIPRSFVLVFNPHRKPFHQASVRESFIRSIDRSEFKDLLHLPILLNSHLSPAIANLSIPSWFPKFNPTSSKTVIEEEKPGPNQKLTLSYTQGSIPEQIAKNLQAQWEKNLELRVELISISSERVLSLDNFASSMYILPSSTTALLKTQLPTKFPEISLEKTFPFVESPLIGFPATQASILTSQSERIISKEYLIFPLYQASKIGFKSEKLLRMEQNPLGIWDFGSVELRS